MPIGEHDSNALSDVRTTEDAGAGPEVTFVNRFTVHGPAEEFEEVFARTSAFMARRPGFVRHSLLREADGAADYVNIAVWTDRASFQQAVQHPEFAPHAAALRALSRSENGLFTARLSVTAGAVGEAAPERTR
ncbi:antibiotic biosynthesis monooxygenase family protein [Streptomyces pseudovenezuelae]|jgi:monooxygenase|uniref:Heme-degrading monooxygenase HmoA n=1 Tax=Streptomyces pseudovenezuelae TaxID=67350 RepID=A0ABT6LCP9_9ACTN|nr:antibiotic biosynthesis monooxygenase [Streptomyces pseudovenezuelae]MDH6213149.1 heme-degrading monooxygenase HmoA [Streptomyces pseudovenezuelae]